MSAAGTMTVAAAVVLAVGCCSRAAAADDRLILGANATRVAGTDGGGGEIDWLHGVDDLGTMSLGVDYQSLAGAKWAYASLSGAATRLGGAGSLTASAELHEGAGRIGAHNFDYNIVAAALGARLSPALLVQLEDRQIEVDTAHGNLPKLTLSLQGGRRWLADVSIAQSTGGNLRTRMGVAHADWHYGDFVAHAGVGVGRVAPEVVALQTKVGVPGQTIQEQFLGITCGFQRGELLLVLDRLRLGGTLRMTLTLNYTIRLGSRRL